jgi:hypothetical protein
MSIALVEFDIAAYYIVNAVSLLGDALAIF